MVRLWPHLPQFHAVEHVVLDAIDFAVPTLMEVAVEPVAEWVALGVGEVKQILYHYFLHHIRFHATSIHTLCRLGFLGRTPFDTP